MNTDILGDLPEGSEIARWAAEGRHHEKANFVSFVDPFSQYVLAVDVDDPVQGYLIRLWTVDDGRDERVAQTVVADRETAKRVASEMAAAAADLAAVHREPSVGLRTILKEEVERSEVDTPDAWDSGWDSGRWENALEEAFEEADVSRAAASLTIKSIDGQDYYYLQWREGPKVTSQHVGPVDPRS